MRIKESHPKTDSVNRGQQARANMARIDALSWLAKTFPEAFNTDLRIRPLKVGIMTDILSYVQEHNLSDISKSKLRQAVVMFSRRVDYMICLKAREMRIDLYGNAVDEVTEEQALSATNKIKKRIEKTIRASRKVAHHRQNNTSNHLHPFNRYQGEQRFNNNSNQQSYQNQQPVMTARQTPNVTVKHKSPRQYDPNAVARLKEKLGLRDKAKEASE
jgi:ProP effector